MTEMQLILQRLDELRADMRENTKAVGDVVTANAVLTERVDNLIGKVDDHLDEDEQIHADLSKKMAGLDKWRTELKTKIGVYAAIAVAVIGAVWDFGKEALASIFLNGG